MKTTQTPTYTNVAIFLHWTIATLILFQLLSGDFMVDRMSNGPEKFQLFQVHKSFGILILILSIFRLLWRLTHSPPPLPDTVPKWQQFAAKSVQWSLYFFMFALPISGWLIVSASPLNIPTKIFRVIPWPNIPGIERSKAASEQFFEYHHYLAMGIVILLLGHIGAALWHYFIKRDAVLYQMALWWKPRPSKSNSVGNADNNN